VDPIVASEWGYQSKDDPEDVRLNFVKDQLEPLRFEILSDALRALDYGCAGFEKVWKVGGGDFVLDCLKPLRVDGMQVVADPTGSFAGIETIGVDGQRKRLGVHKSWLYTYDGEFGYLYGRSRLENLRATAWRDWLDAATDLVKISKKASGKLGKLTTPAGSFKAPDGSTVSWDAVALKVGQMLNSDAVLLHLYHMGTSTPGVLGMQNFDQFVALLKASAVNLEMVDFGDTGPALLATLERMRRNEERMFAGYFQSPRTGMATQGGTKADAGEHRDSSIVNSENVATSIARSFNRQVVDDILVLKFGEAARGTVWVNPGKLTDANVATDNKILDAVLLDPQLREQYLLKIDLDSITDRRAIPHEEPIVLEQPLPTVPPITGAVIKDPNIPQANPANDNLTNP
jgi:hypothetical protein